MRATVFGEVDDFVRNIIGWSSYHGLPVTNIPYSGTSIFDLKFEVAHIICHKYISNIAACPAVGVYLLLDGLEKVPIYLEMR